MDHATDNNQFFLTAPAECPYIEGLQERKLFTHLDGSNASVVHNLLSHHGFRRSQNLIYRPACSDCNACQSVRIVAKHFKASERHKRNIKLNKDVSSKPQRPIVSMEQYDLFKRYLASRHDSGGMSQMSFMDYEFMVEDTSVQTMLIEYRLKPENDEDPGQLIGCALTDVMQDGLSMVYSFYDPDMPKRSLGVMMILDHIHRAKLMGDGFVYLGYWVQNSPKMAYKADYEPLEVESGALGWLPLKR